MWCLRNLRELLMRMLLDRCCLRSRVEANCRDQCCLSVRLFEGVAKKRCMIIDRTLYSDFAVPFLNAIFLVSQASEAHRLCFDETVTACYGECRIRVTLHLEISCSSWPSHEAQHVACLLSPSPAQPRFILLIASLCAARSRSASLRGCILLRSPTTSFALPK